MKYYIVHVVGCIEPYLYGGFSTSYKRDGEAKSLGDEDGVFALDIDWDAKTINISSYSGAFMEGET